MTAAPATTSRTGGADRLANVFQDLLTAVVRIQARRERVTNAEDFSGQVLSAVAAAREQAAKLGHTETHIRAAIFAIVAFLDEACLKSPNPVFREWARSPLQNRLFKTGHVAGETFFDYIRDLLNADNSEGVADVLEIYLLCLLLGYRGRYGNDGGSSVRAIQDRVADKIKVIRGAVPLLAPSALPSIEAAPPERDRLTKVLIVIAVLLCALVALVLLFYGGSLRSRIALASPSVAAGVGPV